MDPANGHNFVCDLGFEQLYLTVVGHRALVLLACLGRHDQARDDQFVVLLDAAENCTGFDLGRSVEV